MEKWDFITAIANGIGELLPTEYTARVIGQKWIAISYKGREYTKLYVTNGYIEFEGRLDLIEEGGKKAPHLFKGIRIQLAHPRCFELVVETLQKHD